MATNYQTEISSTLDYLSSQESIDSLNADPYWPKWNSPWWHMLLLHEMGEVRLIPAAVIETFVARLNRLPLKIFPIHPGEMPAGIDPYLDCPCHCQLGSVYQVLSGWGVDVDKELPWIRPWLLRYQMADGGLNCDNDAYLVQDETPSSMVGTIAVFEAILNCTPRPWTDEERTFLEKGAKFLMGRKLMFGSQTKYNSSERESAKESVELCFPRFYFYDVLRGLNALLIWSEKAGQPVPKEAIQEVVLQLEDRFPEDVVRNERISYEGAKTFLPPDSGEGKWVYGSPAGVFPLLEKVSAVGEESPFLSKQWSQVRARIERLSNNQRQILDDPS